MTNRPGPTAMEGIERLLREQGLPQSKLAESLAEKPKGKSRGEHKPGVMNGTEKAEPRTIRFTIPGEPIGAPRMSRMDKWKQRPCVVRYRAWKDLARSCAVELPETNQILSLSWTAYFEPSASWSKKKTAALIGTIHRFRPDRDNIDKALLDALFKQDSGIGVGTIAKYWGTESRLEVVIVVSG